MSANSVRRALKARIRNNHTAYAPAVRSTATQNNVDKAHGVHKGRKLPLGGTEVFQLRYEEELGSTVIASRPWYRRVSAYHPIGKQTAGAAIGDSGIILAIAKPVGGNYAFEEFVAATELGAS